MSAFPTIRGKDTYKVRKKLRTNSIYDWTIYDLLRTKGLNTEAQRHRG
jgi:hypothetical protein